MAHKVIILYRLYMPYYFLGTFTEYPYLYIQSKKMCRNHNFGFLHIFIYRTGHYQTYAKLKNQQNIINY